MRITFDIPQGFDGGTGAADQPGEVSQVDLNYGLQNMLSQTSNNTNTVSTLGNVFGDPASEELRNKMDELINALRR